MFDYSGGRPSRRRAGARAVDQGHPDAPSESMRWGVRGQTQLMRQVWTFRVIKMRAHSEAPGWAGFQLRGGGVWHKALVVGSGSLWRRLLASRP